jgi:TolB-like protein
MASVISGYNYDIFISYRQKDNKGDRWVTQFVEALKTELEATFKEDISVYFDENPHDGLLETHDVDESLKEKLKCLIFIPIISRTYCDPNSFAWEHEFKAFIEKASKDQYGLKVRLHAGNVANRVMPIQIHDLDAEDKKLVEDELGGFMRGVEFIYKESGVNRPLTKDDEEKDNLNKTKYRNQINKVANAIKEIIKSLENKESPGNNIQPEKPTYLQSKKTKLNTLRKNKKTFIAVFALMLSLAICSIILFRSGILSNSATDKIKISIAVLPFDNWSHSEEFSYMGDAIANEICTQTAKIRNFHVISFTSSSNYRAPDRPPITQIGKELGAKFIIEGSVERQKEAVSIHVQIINSEKDIHVWADEFKGNWDDIFIIRAQIAIKIAEQLKTILSTDEIKRIEEIPTKNPEAYNLYLKGNYYKDQYFSLESFQKAAELYEDAIKLDTEFIQAYVNLVVVNAQLYIPKTWDHTRERLEKCKAALNKVIELDPENPEVHFAKGYYFEWIDQNFRDALNEYNLAIKDLSNNTALLNSIGTILLRQGKASESTEFFIKSYETDPIEEGYMVSWSFILQREWTEAEKWIDIYLSTHPESSLGYYKKAEINIYGYGRLEKAREVLEDGKNHINNFYQDYYIRLIETYSRNFHKALEILKRDTWRPHYNYVYRGQILDLMGNHNLAVVCYDSARIMLEKLIIESPENAFHHASLGLAYAGLGEKEEAIQCGKKAVELHPIHSDPYSSGEEILLEYAIINIAVGNFDEAIDYIETLLSIPGQLTIWRLKLDPLFDPIRSFERFRKIVNS